MFRVQNKLQSRDAFGNTWMAPLMETCPKHPGCALPAPNASHCTAAWRSRRRSGLRAPPHCNNLAKPLRVPRAEVQICARTAIRGVFIICTPSRSLSTRRPTHIPAHVCSFLLRDLLRLVRVVHQPQEGARRRHEPLHLLQRRLAVRGDVHGNA